MDIGFPRKIVEIIMTCVSMVSMQIVWNGETTKTFKPIRVIWQKDPLSPYLVVLCMERLLYTMGGG